MSEKMTPQGMQWEKTPCPKCGKEITTHQGGRAAHIRNCKGKVEESEPKRVVEIDPLAIGDAKLQTPKAANPTLAEEIRYSEEKTGQAVAAIERVKKEAPNAIVSFTGSSDEFKSEEKRLRAEGKVPDDHVFYWGDVRQHKSDIHKYIPVDDGGRQPQVGENQAYHRHKSLANAEHQAATQRSKSMFQDTSGEVESKPLFNEPVRPNPEK